MVVSKILMDDYTPGPVALQGIEAIDSLFFETPPARVLDPSAGSGVFGQVCRQVWPRAQLDAIEAKRGESWYLRCNYDQFKISKYEDALIGHVYDLVVTNPPFHSWPYFVTRSLEVARPGGIVALLGLTSWGSRSKEGSSLFDQVCPIAQLRIMGAVSYRPKGTDSRDYCWWVFRKPLNEELDVIELQCWATLNLPRLGSSARRWNEGKKPGRKYGETFQTGQARCSLPALRW